MMTDYYMFLLSLLEGLNDSQLYRYLLEVDYIWTIPLDKNRAQDGIDLRCWWANSIKLTKEQYEVIFNSKACSMLEMLLAFAIRIENDFMATAEGNNTSKWFYQMLISLGMSDDITNFDRGRVDHALLMFFNHQISLFQVPNVDISKMELWNQMNYWINYIN